MAGLGDVAALVRPGDGKLISRLGRAIGSGDPETAAEVAAHMLRTDVEKVS